MGAWLLVTEATYKSGLYQQYAKKIRYEFHEVTPETPKDVTKALTMVKSDKLAKSGLCIQKIMEKLWQQENIGFTTAYTGLPSGL